MPRPPAAPLEGRDQPGKRPNAGFVRILPPPSGEGPVLEWYEAPRSQALQAGAFAAATVMAFLTVSNWGFGWMGFWQLWLVVLAGPVYFFFAGRQRMAAGAEWFRSGRHHLKIYELTEVKVTGMATGVSWALDLKDAGGRRLSISLWEYQRNPKLWDLVYNGILHSVRAGAETNERAWDHLHLR